MTQPQAKRPTTGKFSAKDPGLPNADPKRADAKLRDFTGKART